MGERVVAENCDLDEVLRSCSSAIDYTTYESSSVSENPLSFLASLKFEEEEDPFSIFNIVVEEKNNGFEESQDAYTNITSKDGELNGQQQQEQVKSSSPDLFVFGDPKNLLSSRHVEQQELQPEQQDLQQKKHQHHSQSGAISFRPMQCQPPRGRKRNYPQKRIVCHVTIEDLSGDLWAWRKYGQKPIKGSPYPRNYYRCSRSKGCAARKQVERSSTDPNLFIVSYSGDHTHARPAQRHSLAGITRNKFSTTQTAQPPATDGNASFFSPASSTSRSPRAMVEAKNNQHERAAEEGGEVVEPEEEDDEDDLLIPNLAAVLNDDLFKGLEELSSCIASGGDSSSNSRGGEVG